MSRPDFLRSVSYNATERRLTVAFLVGTYEYNKVPESVGAQFVSVAAGPFGPALEFFQSKIEGKYPSERIEE
jgi:hypothetical protein